MRTCFRVFNLQVQTLYKLKLIYGYTPPLNIETPVNGLKLYEGDTSRKSTNKALLINEENLNIQADFNTNLYGNKNISHFFHK